MINYLIQLLPAIVTGLVLFYWQRKQTARDGIHDEIDRVNREVANATMELAYATACAVKRGKANGEVERAVKVYEEAKKHQAELGQKMMQRMNK